MKMVKCTKVVNHFYDGDRYDSCPHCLLLEGKDPGSAEKINAPISSGNESDNSKKESGKKGFFYGLFGNQKVRGKEKEETPVQSPESQKETSDIKTHSLWQDVNDEPEEESSPDIKQNSSVGRSETTDATENTGAEQMKEEKSVPSVSKQINRVAMTGSIGDIKTVAYYGFEEDIDPVAGWLAVITTDDKGTSFEVKCGRTSIGRNGNGQAVDISLDKDTTVSRGSQASITYDSKKKRFLIKSNDGKTAVYVNDEILMDYIELKAYDRILVGATELIFVPLCSNEFSWDS